MSIIDLESLFPLLSFVKFIFPEWKLPRQGCFLWILVKRHALSSVSGRMLPFFPAMTPLCVVCVCVFSRFAFVKMFSYSSASSNLPVMWSYLHLPRVGLIVLLKSVSLLFFSSNLGYFNTFSCPPSFAVSSCSAAF